MASRKIKFVLFILLLPFLTTAKIEVKKVLSASNGACNGSIEVVMTGDRGPYTISIQGASNQQVNNINDSYTFQNLCSGSYILDVSGGGTGGCASTFNIFIDDVTCNDINIYLVKSSDATNCEEADGYVGLEIENENTGVGFEYEVSNGQSGNSKGGDYLYTPVNYLPKGDYSITVVDDNGCSTVFPFSIGPASCEPSCPPEFEATLINQTNISCNGLSDGTLQVEGTGGTAPYTYEWNNSATTATISDLSAGLYLVTVTDANDCTATASYTITEPTALAIQLISKQEVSCKGTATGSIEIQGTNGTPPYDYQWAHTNENTSMLVNLAAGTYELTMLDSEGCSVEKSYLIEEPESLFLPSFDIVNATNENSNDGEIHLNVSGGWGPDYHYECEGIANNFSTSGVIEEDPGSATITGLAAGDYLFTITDNEGEGCSRIAQVIVEFGCNSDLEVELVSKQDASCTGAQDGFIQVVGSGGATPYTFLWDTGENTALIENKTPGNYEVTITDANNCTTTSTFTLSILPEPTISTQITNTTCGQDNGAIDVTVTGHSSFNYIYTWRHVESNASYSDENLADLPSGTYELTVDYGDKCELFETVTVGGSSGSFNVSASRTKTGNCNGSPVTYGEITVNVTSGTPPFDYILTNNTTVEKMKLDINQRSVAFDELDVDTYDINVTDANGCVQSTTFDLKDHWSLEVTGIVSNATCGNSNGAIDLQVTGGTPDYEYEWSHLSGFNHDQDVSNLSPGVYEVTVEDNNGFFGCIRKKAFEIIDEITIEATFNVIGADCSGDGQIQINVLEGVPPYTYAWRAEGSNVSWQQHGPTNSNNHTIDLALGTYEVRISDSDGCSYTEIHIVDYDESLLDIQSINTIATSCSVESGIITINIVNGTAPFTYNLTDEEGNLETINSSARMISFSNLGVNIYDIEVTDQLSCSRTATETITDDSNFRISVFKTNPTCGSNNGHIELETNLGTPPYTIDWAHIPGEDDGINNLVDLSPDTYVVIVTDNAGCERIESRTLINIDDLVANFSSRDADCNGNGGSLTMNVTSGSPPYTYYWRASTELTWNQSFPTSNTSFTTGVESGSYAVKVTNEDGCEVIGSSFSVAIGSRPFASYQNVFHNCNSDGGEIRINVSGGSGAYTYQWKKDGSGAVVSTDKDLVTSSKGLYRVTITDASSSSCWNSPIDGRTLYDSLSVSPKCTQKSNGSFDIRARKQGGSSDVTYQWELDGNSISQTQGFFNTAIGGTYSVTVTDNTTACPSVFGSCSTNASSSVNESFSNSNGFESDISVEVYPNPFDNLLYLDINSGKEQTLEIEILDLVGRTIYRQSVNTETGLNKLTIDMASTNASSGLYQVLIKGKDTAPQNFKVVRVK